MKRPELFQRHLLSFSREDLKAFHDSGKYYHPVRSLFSRRHLAGDGIEIGAQALPTDVDPQTTRVRYVDRLDPQLNSRLEKAEPSRFLEPDFYLEADALSEFGESSLDFVIAHHVLEHMDDPISALREWLRVVRPGGILFLGLPNPRCGEFDFQLEATSLDHLLEVEGIREIGFREKHKRMHLEAFEEICCGFTPGSPEFKFKLNFDLVVDRRIHYHRFSPGLMVEILRHIGSVELRDGFFIPGAVEMLFVVAKQTGAISLPRDIEKLSAELFQQVAQ